MTSFNPQPLVLTGTAVRLEPLALHHAADLAVAGADRKLWRYLTPPAAFDERGLRSWVAGVLSEASQKGQLPFAIIDQPSQQAVGSTRFMDIDRDNAAMEIGWTWLSPEAQRTAINTECKYLLLRHAFETLGARRIMLKTDRRNVRSQDAIRRIGAQYEGTFRRNRVCWDGFVRDTVYFSILRDEWPQVAARLQALLSPRRE